MENDYEALIVGGGAAGLTAALVLGRARVRTLLVDAGGQSNLSAGSVGGLLGFGGAPAELYAAAHAQLAEHPAVAVRRGTVSAIAPGFAATVDGDEVRAARVLLATGMEYERPAVEGADALWGGAVFNCPYCHGWEHRDGRLAVLGGTMAAHRARLLRAWTDDVIVLAADLAPEDRAALDAAGIPVDERPVAALEADGPRLRAVRFADGGRLERDGILAPTRLRPRNDFAQRLGCELTETPVATGVIVTDARRATTVEGVFAAGDAAALFGGVAISLGAGVEAAAGLHQSLVFGLS